ncbi:MAG: DUF6785 family protein [Candidatus Bathyarchaeia archaeon]
MSERIEEKFPWLSIILLSIVLGAVGVAWLHFLPGPNLYNFYNFGVVLCSSAITSAPFILLLVCWPLSKSSFVRKRISPVTLLSVYAVGLASSWLLEWSAVYNIYGRVIGSRWMYPEYSIKHIPPFMAPPEPIARQLLSGHLPVPWDAWISSIVFWWVYQVIWSIFMVSLATVFRRLWIDIEKIPFPYAQVAYELVSETGLLKSKSGRWIRPFTIGIILGIVFQIPVFLAIVFPWFPDIYGWRGVCGGGEWYVTTDSPLASIVGLGAFNKHPLFVAIGYLIPVTVLFSIWLWHLIYLILVQAAYAMGYYTALPTMGGCGRAWCPPSPQYADPFKFMSLSFAGGALGLALIHLILNRKYLLETFRAAFSSSKASLRGIEINEPMSYRAIYLMFFASIILAVSLLMVMGISIYPAIVIIVTIFIGYIANCRVYGLTGMHILGDDFGHFLVRLLVWPQPPSPLTREWALSVYITSLGLGRPNETILGCQAYTAAASYRMASLMGVSNKTAFKAMLIPMIIVPLVTVVTWIQLMYSYGANTFPVSARAFTWSPLSEDVGYISASWAYSKPGTDPLWPHIILGAVITGALYYLHSKFLWFPLEPIGFIFGTSFISVLWGAWFPFLIAWILKTLTLRMGGSKAYESYGVPTAAGFTCGYMLAVLVLGALSIIRFFIPY